MLNFTEMFVSEIKHLPVVDCLQEPIGQVKDIIVSVGEVFPKVTGLVVKIYPDNKEKVLLMGEIKLIGKHFVVTKEPQGQVAFSNLRQDEWMLRRDLLDTQIVDTEGKRLTRINDLKLAQVENDVRLIAADVGLSGLVRRLRILKPVETVLSWFKNKVPETLIGWDHVQQLKPSPAAGQITVPKTKLSDLHPADIATIISQVSSSVEKTAIFASLDEKAAAEALHELEPKIQALLLLTINTKKAIGILDKMPTDEVADVLQDLPADKSDELLRMMKVKKSGQVRKLMQHEEKTAGGLMTTEFISAKADQTAQEVINTLRQLAPDAETIYYIYILDNEDKLVGALSLRKLIVSPLETKVSEIMNKDFSFVRPQDNQRKVGEMISKYNLLALPVLDNEGKMLGIVTVDDVVDFILPPISRRHRHLLG